MSDYSFKRIANILTQKIYFPKKENNKELKFTTVKNEQINQIRERSEQSSLVELVK